MPLAFLKSVRPDFEARGLKPPTWLKVVRRHRSNVDNKIRCSKNTNLLLSNKFKSLSDFVPWTEDRLDRVSRCLESDSWTHLRRGQPMNTIERSSKGQIGWRVHRETYELARVANRVLKKAQDPLFLKYWYLELKQEAMLFESVLPQEAKLLWVIASKVRSKGLRLARRSFDTG